MAAPAPPTPTIAQLQRLMSGILVANEQVRVFDEVHEYPFSHWRARNWATDHTRTLDRARALLFWAGVPARRNVHTQAAGDALVKTVSAAVRDALATTNPKDDCRIVGAIQAAVDCEELTVPGPDLGPRAGLVDACRDLCRADKEAWAANPRSALVLDVRAECGIQTALRAKIEAITALVAPEVLEAARAMCAGFLAQVLDRLENDIQAQLRAKPNKTRATFRTTRSSSSKATTVSLKHVPKASVFAKVLVHGLLWRGLPVEWYPSWFPDREMIAMTYWFLPTVDAVLVCNRADPVPIPRDLVRLGMTPE